MIIGKWYLEAFYFCPLTHHLKKNWSYKFSWALVIKLNIIPAFQLPTLTILRYSVGECHDIEIKPKGDG